MQHSYNGVKLLVRHEGCDTHERNKQQAVSFGSGKHGGKRPHAVSRNSLGHTVNTGP